MMKTIRLNVDETLRKLDYWLDKVEACYKEEVRQSMENFKKECGLKK